MKIKSTVWHWLAAGSLCAGLLCGMGLEGNAQVGAPITDGQFVTAMVLVLAAGLFMRLGFAAQELAREQHPECDDFRVYHVEEFGKCKKTL